MNSPLVSAALKNFGRKSALVVAGTLLFSNAFATQKRYGSHQHGVATVNVVAEGKSVTVQLNTPADSIYGFEHKAVKKKDIETRDAAVAKLKSSAQSMFLLDASLNCKLSSAEVDPFVTDSHSSDAKAENTKVEEKHNHKEKHSHKKKGTHAEVHATFQFECEKPLSGSTMSFAAQKHFKALRTLKVQVLSGDKQSGLTVKKDKGSVSL